MRDLLLSEIRAFAPGDDDEKAHHLAILSLIETSSFSSRTNYEPGHITASAFIVDPTRTNVLLHYHRRLGRWLQMGGHLEDGESPPEAALREATEESGLVDLIFVMPGVFDLDVHQIPCSRIEPAHLHFDLRYLLSTTDPSAIVRCTQESLAVKWVSFPEAIDLMAEPCSERAIRTVGRILARSSERV
jgi:8-oxo-dGTP pyrophosphatase MutT (NUDIX family)